MSLSAPVRPSRRIAPTALGAGHGLSLYLGTGIVALMTLLAVIGTVIAPYSPTQAVSGAQLQPPSAGHWFGTDSVGMDVFSRVIAAPRTDLTIAVLSTVVALGIGSPLGAIAGYYRNTWSEILMRISDLIHSFPVFLLAMAAVIVAGQRMTSLIAVIGFVNAPIYIRLMRAEVLSLRERTFIEAAVTLGEPPRRIMFRHLVPNAASPIISQASITVGVSMLLTAGLSFVGAGVRVPTPEWGSMIAIGASHIVTGEWWPSLFPGLALATTVGGFALLGDSLPRLFDPLKRKT
jgi:peptide/nickel transport system permease protein